MTSSNKVTRFDPDNSAIKLAVKKNRYSLTKSSGSAGDALSLSISSNDIVWYLPSKNEISSDLKVEGVDGETPITGMYWTSTTDNNTTDKSWVYDPSKSGEEAFMSTYRTIDTYKCRAVRTGYPK